MKKKNLKKIIKDLRIKEANNSNKLLKEANELCNDILKDMGYSVGIPFIRPPKDQIETILVSNCQGCPFVMDDRDGYYGCSIGDVAKFKMEAGESLPSDKVHDKCPLKNMNYRIRLK